MSLRARVQRSSQRIRVSRRTLNLINQVKHIIVVQL